MAVHIANELAALGHQSHLCTTRKEGSLKNKLNPQVGYFFMKKKFVIDFSGVFQLVKYIRKNKIDIIHAHSSSYFTAWLVKLVYNKVLIIWHDHYGNSELLNQRPYSVLRFCSKRFHHIISVNSLLKDWAVQHLKTRNNTFLRNFSVLNHSEKRETILKGIDGKRIVCLANLRPQKDHLNLLKAFKEIKKNDTDWTLHLVGLDVNDDYSNAVKEFISQNDLKTSVFIYGSCNDIQHILQQSSIGVLSSKSEGLPLALLEYGFAKLPVVVTNVGQCSEVVNHLIEGVVVEPSNATELKQAIEELIANKQKRSSYAQAFHKKISNEFSASVYLQKLIKIYNSALN